MIYLDNAATTLQKPQVVYDAVYDAMKTLGNSGRGFSGAALGASRMIYEARQTLCDFFGGSDPSRLVFTSNATEALNMAIQGMFLPGDHVITTQLEHNSVLRPLYACRKRVLNLRLRRVDRTERQILMRLKQASGQTRKRSSAPMHRI